METQEINSPMGKLTPPPIIMIVRKEIPHVCKYCGAPLKGYRCEYCGVEYKTKERDDQ